MSHHYLGDGWPPENAQYQNFDNQYYPNQIPTLQSQSPGAGYGRGTTATPRYGQFDPMPYGQYGESSLASSGLVSSAMSSPAMLHSHHQYSHAPMDTNRYAPVPIAPNPSGLEQMNHAKRMREEALQQHASQKRRRSSPLGSLPTDQRPSTSPYLTEEEQLLLKLKQDERLPWKEIAHRFELAFNRTFQVPALQMRYKRLREKMRTWTEDDVQALEKAYNYWEESKFDIIAQKMMEFGASEKWPARLCEKKWLEMHPQDATHPSTPLNIDHLQPPPLSDPPALPPSFLPQPRQQLPRPSESPFRPPTIPPLPSQTLPSNSGRSSPTAPPPRPQPHRTYSGPTRLSAPPRPSHLPTMTAIKPPESESFEMPGLATTIFSAVPYPQQPPRPRRPP